MLLWSTSMYGVSSNGTFEVEIVQILVLTYVRSSLYGIVVCIFACCIHSTIPGYIRMYGAAQVLYGVAAGIVSRW